VATAIATPVTTLPGDPKGVRSTAPGISRNLDREEIGTLVKRGQAYLQNADVAAARLVFLRAAEAGDPQAAMALGASYDPELGAIGAAVDIAKARAWYEKASELGLTEARRRLHQLSRQSQ
jgi:TPR repeat protein